MSLKISDPKIQIALLCDEQSIKHLSQEELNFFNKIIYIEENLEQVGYQKIKLLMYKYTPFEHTIYMDADSIWLDKKPSWLFGELFGKEFQIGYSGTYVTNRPNNSYTFWGDPKSIMQYHKLSKLPQTVSGFFYFEKCEKSKQIFNKALEVYDDAEAPTVKWGNGKADEYCFNVAIAELEQQENLSVFYFDKLDGKFISSQVYENFWGIAMGGHRVKEEVIKVYDALVKRNCKIFGIEQPRYHINKSEVIKERTKS